MPRLLLAGAVLAGVSICQQEAPPAPVDKAVAEKMLASAEAVAKEVAELTGRAFKQPVAKSVMTKDELRKELAAMMQKEYGGGKLERLEGWLRALGLFAGERDLQATMTEVLLSQIGGFYDPERHAFFMMVESAAYGDVLNRMMIAHELCHALDDQYVDLRRMLKPLGRDPTEDETYVVGGVVEGNATALMFRWMAGAMKQGASVADMSKMAEQQKDQMEVLLQAPPYCTLLAANYMVGHHFMTKGEGLPGMTAGGAEDLMIEVCKQMPRSSEQLLHPEKYWEADKRDEPVVLADDAKVEAAVAERTGKTVVERNTLGEMVAALVAGSKERRLNPALMVRADYWTNKAARGWGGDRMFLVGQPVEIGKPLADGGVVWLTAWDTVEDREEFVAAVQKYRGEAPGFAVVADGKVAAFGFGSARALGDDGLKAVLGAASWTRDGKPWSK